MISVAMRSLFQYSSSGWTKAMASRDKTRSCLKSRGNERRPGTLKIVERRVDFPAEGDGAFAEMTKHIEPSGSSSCLPTGGRNGLRIAGQVTSMLQTENNSTLLPDVSGVKRAARVVVGQAGHA